jgi:tyrosyl-tRNA synthetase
MLSKEQKIKELLTRGVAEVIDSKHLQTRLMGEEKLRVKFGIDPTSPHIHLGRSVVLRKLRDFQDLGHKVVFIIGDFTGVIGDTSDKESERPMLSADAIEENMRTYMEQAGKIINLDTAEVHYNSTWLDKLGYEEIGEQADAFSLAEFIARENIQKRLDDGKRVSLREVLYPLMQGFDSVAINADVELGGTDQRFNLLAGRRLQEAHGQKPQDILMTNIILGTDGRKMSSSWGNTINLLHLSNDMFGKVMSIPDELLESYFIHCTRIPMEEVKNIMSAIKDGANPRDAKIQLAKEIVMLYHGAEEAEKAETYFVETFSKGVIPKNVPVFEPVFEPALEGYENVESFIARIGLAKSKSDARRKIEQGGISIGDEKIVVGSRMLDKELDNGKVMKVGKKDFVKIVFSESK